MVTTIPEPPAGEAPRPGLARRLGLTRLGADLAFVLPGFFVSLFAFVLLVPLFAVSVGTLVIWIGALLLPLTLFIASGFAELSRRRLRGWGASLPEARYRRRGPGLTGLWRWVADPRRWLDLVFETVVAFPLHVFTFAVSVTWIAGATGGLTWWAWAFHLPIPDDEPMWPGEILEALTGGAAPDALTHSFAFESAFYLVCGLAFLLTLPLIMRLLASLDAAVMAAALGGGGGGLGGAEHDGRPSAGAAPSEPFAAPSAAPFTATAPAPAQGSDPADPAATAPIPTPSAEGWGWIVAGFTAVAAIAIGWPVLAAVSGVHVALAMLVVVAQAAGLILALRLPAVGIALAALAPAAAGLLASNLSTAWPWPVTMLIVQAVLVLIVALRRPWPWALTAWALPQLAVLVVAIRVDLDDAIPNLVVCASISAGVGAIGAILRLWLLSRGALRVERSTSAELDARRRELAERNRIAQELHDVVAHSMSVISVQATTAKYRLEGVGDEAAGEFESIAESSRQALAEMRGLLAVLRTEDGEAELGPRPGLGDIPGLVEATRRSGASIEWADGTASASAPPATGLTAYRIVQEALSNAVRHAPGSAIRVSVRAGEEGLEIEVVNGPPAGDAEGDPAPGAGLGLAGIADRAAALGGMVEAAPTGDGGFRLRAILPLG